MDEEATSIGVYLAILHGLERLIIADCGLGRPFSDPVLVDAIIKLSIDRSVRHGQLFQYLQNPQIQLSGAFSTTIDLFFDSRN